MKLLEFTERGIYCEQADVYLDPWKPVNKALISHGHSDHAYFGHQHYLCTTDAKPVIHYRLNTVSPVETVDYNEKVTINGVNFSFHPAGHILGSAQIRVEYKGDVWVFSGDYKTQDDGLSKPFEPVRCNTFITESTFGLPIFKWKEQNEIFEDVNIWWRKNASEDKVSILAAYALGKAQRILMNVDDTIGKIFVHGAIHNVNNIIRNQGFVLQDTTLITKETNKQDWQGALVICPPSAIGSPWMRKFLPYSLGVASGWMNLRGVRRRRGADRGFSISDHADFEGLNWAIKETGAEHIYVTHGYTEVFAQWLRGKGLDATDVKTKFEGEVGELEDLVSPEDNQVGNTTAA
jgi:putative mRNA 3-end processing factor